MDEKPTNGKPAPMPVMSPFANFASAAVQRDAAIGLALQMDKSGIRPIHLQIKLLRPGVDII